MTAGNTLVEARTFIAVLTGTILGGGQLLIASHVDLREISTITISIVGLGLFPRFYMPVANKANPNLKLNLHFIQTSL